MLNDFPTIWNTNWMMGEKEVIPGICWSTASRIWHQAWMKLCTRWKLPVWIVTKIQGVLWTLIWYDVCQCMLFPWLRKKQYDIQVGWLGPWEIMKNDMEVMKMAQRRFFKHWPYLIYLYMGYINENAWLIECMLRPSRLIGYFDGPFLWKNDRLYTKLIKDLKRLKNQSYWI